MYIKTEGSLVQFFKKLVAMKYREYILGTVPPYSFDSQLTIAWSYNCHKHKYDEVQQVLFLYRWFVLCPKHFLKKKIAMMSSTLPLCWKRNMNGNLR